MLTSSSRNPPDNNPLNTPPFLSTNGLIVFSKKQQSTPHLQVKPWTLLFICCCCDVKNFKGTLNESFMCLHHICPFITSGYSALQRLPGFHLRFDKAAHSQFRGHGPLRKEFPYPAAGGQPGGGGAQQWRGGWQGLEGGATRPGVTADWSLCLRSAGLDRFQSMKPNTDVTSVSNSLKAKSEDKCRSHW